ncbi:unnamed protein product, partial [Rotaria sordida]
MIEILTSTRCIRRYLLPSENDGEFYSPLIISGIYINVNGLNGV